MKNRAKCKLCGDIIESFHRYDCVSCGCGEITIDGGQEYLNCTANDWQNFLRVDDEGNEIIVTVVEKEEENQQAEKASKALSRQEQLDMLEAMLKNIENLPQQAMSLPINHYDFYSYMLLICSVLRSDFKE